MIIYKTGSIFDSEAEALVNPVNCVGVMGAGLAKEFKTRFPEMFKDYKVACEFGSLFPGRVWIWATNPYYIICFPTKYHWKNQSDIADITLGLHDLRGYIKSFGITSIAVPRIGCGLGGLDWAEVKPLIEEILGHQDLQEVVIEVYSPYCPFVDSDGLRCWKPDDHDSFHE